MLAIFAVIIGGIVTGRLLVGWRLAFVQRLITFIIWALLFLLGVEVGSDPAVVGSLATLGAAAFAIFAMYRVTIEDGLNKNSRSHLSLADAPIFKDAEAVMALPEVATAYTTDLKKLTFDKSKMPPIGKAVEALKNLHEILVRFEAYRTKKQNEEQP